MMPIEAKELQFEKEIGSGGFATVYEASYRKSPVAVKGTSLLALLVGSPDLSQGDTHFPPLRVHLPSSCSIADFCAHLVVTVPRSSGSLLQLETFVDAWRKELSILLELSHQNITTLVGFAFQPLLIVIGSFRSPIVLSLFSLSHFLMADL